MLKTAETIEVDELYLNMLDEGSISRIGVNNGIILSDSWAAPLSMEPKVVRMLDSKFNLPLILAAAKSYECPVEVTSTLELQTRGDIFGIRDVVVESRNRARGLPPEHPWGYRQISKSDMYSYGHAYNVLINVLGVPAYKFSEESLDLSIEQEYIDKAAVHHAMSDALAFRHVSTVCALLVDPRRYIGADGKFEYYVLPDALNVDSIMSGCSIARQLIVANDGHILPNDGKEVRKLFRRVTKQDRDFVELGGFRSLCDILTTAIDDLGVTLRSKLSRASKDAELVRQELHWIVNTWLSRIYGSDWTPDLYCASLFDIPEEDADV